jgi:hypothetical protein
MSVNYQRWRLDGFQQRKMAYLSIEPSVRYTTWEERDNQAGRMDTRVAASSRPSFLQCDCEMLVNIIHEIGNSRNRPLKFIVSDAMSPKVAESTQSDFCNAARFTAFDNRSSSHQPPVAAAGILDNDTGTRLLETCDTA